MSTLPTEKKLPTGAGKTRFHTGASRPPLTVYSYLPAGLPEDAPVVFVLHGTKRDAELYRDVWAAAAELYRFVLLCPRFRKRDYPRGTYHRGNVLGESGDPNPRSEWTFGAIEALFDRARRATGNTSEHYHLYGHSAGGQFVHRMLLLAPEARVEAAVAANTGWYTMPDREVPFPYGLKGTPATEDTLRRALSRPLTLLLGGGDTDPDDPFLRTTEEALKQGATRYERGHAFHAAARRKAEELGVDLRWNLRVVPGAGHLDRQMMPAAVREMFEGRAAARQDLRGSRTESGG